MASKKKIKLGQSSKKPIKSASKRGGKEAVKANNKKSAAPAKAIAKNAAKAPAKSPAKAPVMPVAKSTAKASIKPEMKKAGAIPPKALANSDLGSNNGSKTLQKAPNKTAARPNGKPDPRAGTKFAPRVITRPAAAKEAVKLAPKAPPRKFAVITGASSGIGYELAKQFVQNGFDLLIAADEGAIVETAQGLRAFGGDVQGLRVDLAKGEGVDQLFEEIKKTGKPLDALVLNAGVAVSGSFAKENKLEDELNLIGLNITSVVHLAKHVLPQMVERGEGRVMITSSIAALMPGPFFATYAASKAFLLSFAEALFNELKDTGVTVTALMPGATDTNFFTRAGMEDTKVAQGEKDDPALVAKQAFTAMMKGDDRIIAGSLKNKFAE